MNNVIALINIGIDVAKYYLINELRLFWIQNKSHKPNGIGQVFGHYKKEFFSFILSKFDI